MKSINIHKAKTHLSKLVELAAAGEPFVIAKAGKPLVKVSALTAPADDQVRRIGFMAGQFNIPADFDRMAEDEISWLFTDSE
jgi:antitoxin (DNA-binding transcriptional repressor) of toxin-antitoxin stability system